jgi:hypothetical protein
MALLARRGLKVRMGGTDNQIRVKARHRVSCCLERAVAHTPRHRERLADRLRPELGEDRPQRADARRERVAVILDYFVKLLGECGAFFAVRSRIIGPDLGSVIAGGEGSPSLPVERLDGLDDRRAGHTAPSRTTSFGAPLSRVLPSEVLVFGKLQGHMGSDRAVEPKQGSCGSGSQPIPRGEQTG